MMEDSKQRRKTVDKKKGGFYKPKSPDPKGRSIHDVAGGAFSGGESLIQLTGMAGGLLSVNYPSGSR